MADEDKKVEFKIDSLKFGKDFFEKNNLQEFKNIINNAKGIDKGAFEAFSENTLSAIDFYLEESCPNDISRGHLLTRIVQLCSDYENAPKKKSKKVAKVMTNLKNLLLPPQDAELSDTKPVKDKV